MATRPTGPYGKWIATPPGVGAAEAPRLRLFCVPPAGMGGACFHDWQRVLPPGVELMPFDLPARGARMGERLPYAASLRDLASAVLDGVGAEVFSAAPFVLLGHSFGAWIAYEMCQELRRRGQSSWPWPQPVKLYVSAYRPPQLAAAAHDPDGRSPTLGGLSGSAFWDAFERRYGKNPDLQLPHVRGFIHPLLQADFQLLEAYEPSSLEPLDLPVQAFCAQGDPRCRTAQLSAWAELTAGEFREQWFENMVLPGAWANAHRYVVDNPEALVRFLHADLPIVGRSIPGYAGIAGPLEGAEDEVLAG